LSNAQQFKGPSQRKFMSSARRPN